jgi:hypothetical protein
LLSQLLLSDLTLQWLCGQCRTRRPESRRVPTREPTDLLVRPLRCLASAGPLPVRRALMDPRSGRFQRRKWRCPRALSAALDPQLTAWPVGKPVIKDEEVGASGGFAAYTASGQCQATERAVRFQCRHRPARRTPNRRRTRSPRNRSAKVAMPARFVGCPRSTTDCLACRQTRHQRRRGRRIRWVRCLHRCVTVSPPKFGAVASGKDKKDKGDKRKRTSSLGTERSGGGMCEAPTVFDCLCSQR